MSFFFLSTEIYLTIFLSYLVLHNSFNLPTLLKIKSTFRLTYIFLSALIISLLIELQQYPFSLSHFVKYSSSISFLKIIIIFLFLILLAFSNYYIKQNGLYNSNLLLVSLISLLGILLVVSSNDLIMFFLAIELQSLAFYILASSNKYSIHSTESGLKYFILGSFSSGILLFGITSLYTFTGCTTFSDLQLVLFSNSIPFYNTVSISIIFLTVGFLFKVGSSPLHMWLPDVYEGSPLHITALFTIVPKIAIFIFFLRFYNCVLIDYSSLWKSIIIISSILSMCIGSLGAIFQNRIKRLLAYSTISHTGFILLGFLSNNQDSYLSVIFYLVVYTLSSLLIFLILLNLYINKREIKYIEDLAGLGAVNPFYGLLISVSLLSMAGIPPLLGFFAKYNVLSMAISSGYFTSSIFAILFSVISAFYYIKIIKILFFQKNKELFITKRVNIMLTVLFVLLLFLNSFLFLKLDALYTIISVISNNLSL